MTHVATESCIHRMISPNAELARTGWPAVTRRKKPLPDADVWKSSIEQLFHRVR